MRERVRPVNATVQFISPGKGTRIEVGVPFVADEDAVV
jgi:hypothetical protein